MFKLFSTLAVLTVLTSPFLAVAETSQEKDLQIAKEIKARDRGWSNSQSEMVMTLRTKNGQEIERKMRTLSLIHI